MHPTARSRLNCFLLFLWNINWSRIISQATRKCKGESLLDIIPIMVLVKLKVIFGKSRNQKYILLVRKFLQVMCCVAIEIMIKQTDTCRLGFSLVFGSWAPNSHGQTRRTKNSHFHSFAEFQTLRTLWQSWNRCFVVGNLWVIIQNKSLQDILRTEDGGSA